MSAPTSSSADVRMLPATRTIEPSILYFGTPVALVTTGNRDGTPNIGPISSAWALGWTLVIGLIESAQTLLNLQREGECVVNLASDDLWERVERLAPLTGNRDMPPFKARQYRFCADKFAAGGFTPVRSELVKPPRIAECGLQLEALARAFHPVGNGDPRLTVRAFAVELEVVRVHVHARLIEGERHIRPADWRPLIYNFRHYYGLGHRRGKTFKAEV
ncbi:MAG TPA: flavin reductase family protein [Opitutaceae bacterium]|nr:flavin reductase family protein [Opitutaceae bacterium]